MINLRIIEQNSNYQSLNTKIQVQSLLHEGSSSSTDKLDNDHNGNSSNTFDPLQFKLWLTAREYSPNTIRTMLSYANRYNSISIQDLDKLSPIIRTHIVKALILISKYKGNYQELKALLAKYSIKMHRGNNIEAFLRIMESNNNGDLLSYYNTAKTKVHQNEALFLKFLLHSGLRVAKAITSFNLVVSLAQQNRLNEYYSKDYGALLHLKYGKLFLRKTKNAYLSFVSESMLNDISQSKPIVYSLLRKRLERTGKLRLRLKEFRKAQNTHLLNSGLSESDVNLISGRVGSVLLKFYFTPKLSELGARVLKALESIANLESSSLLS